MNVLFNNETTAAIREKHGITIKYFKTAAAAKAHRTRLYKKAETIRSWDNENDVYVETLRYPKDSLEIAEAEHYHAKIEKQVTRRNLMTGKEFQESINTPLCCSPASNTYWSM